MHHLWIRRRRWRIVDTRRGTQLVCLTAVAQDAGDTRRFLLPCEPSTPAHAAFARRVSPGQALARLAGHLSQTRIAFTPHAAVAARVALHAYQLEPTLALTAGQRRVLVADGVGLGKTIQAGLAIASLVSSHRDARVLIVAPTPLHLQWCDELTSRFALSVVTADGPTLARLRGTLPYLSSPWLLPGLWLTSADFLKQPHVVAGLPSSPWDLVVVDEAHLLAGDSLRHSTLDAITRRATSVVLLTATPHDGDDTRHQRLLALGQRGPHDRLTIFRRLDRPAGPGRRTRWLPITLTALDRQVLAAIDRFQARPQRDGTAESSGLRLLCAVFRRRALSSLTSLRVSIERRLQIISHAPADTWRQATLFDLDLFDDHEVHALHADSRLPLATETAWLTRLKGLCRHGAIGGRSSALASLLRRVPEPVVVFTQYRDTLHALTAAIPPQRTLAIMHGGQSPAEQADARDRFLTGRADVLLATDVASQGLNLHHRCRWVISLDVPATPLRLEQRIGRVDRLGQTRRVHATILTSRHHADGDLRTRLAARHERSLTADTRTSRRWTKAAQSLAAWFDRQRHLARHWHGAATPAPVSMTVTPSQLTRWLGRPATSCTIALARFTRHTGEEIERRVIVTLGDTCADTLDGERRKLDARARVLTARLERRSRAAAIDVNNDTRDDQLRLFVRAHDTPPVTPTSTTDPDTVHVEIEPIVSITTGERP